MPIEIRELHIRVTVNATDGASSGQGVSAGQNRESDKESIIAECVEQVLEILQNKSER